MIPSGGDHVKKTGKIPGRYLFLAAVIVVYILCFFFDQQLAMEALCGFRSMLFKVLPILAFVFILLVLCNYYLKPDNIEKYLGDGSGLRGWFFAVVGGILLMGPPYVLYPMLAKLRVLGARDALIAVFLYNRNVKIPFLPAMVLYLGLHYTLVVSVYIIVFSIINGLLVEWFLRRNHS